MIKTHLILFGILTFVCFSCSSDANIVDVSEEMMEDQTKTAQILNVEHSSLESINVELEANEFHPISTQLLEKSRIERDSRACLNARYKGDLDDDQILSVKDIILIYSLIKEYDDSKKYPESGNDDMRLNVTKEYFGKVPSFWQVAQLAHLSNFDEGGSTVTYLDENDAAILVDVIIGYCE